ncbi:MAG: hypothetical protein LWW94_08830 [Candidatus Desulfofervidaceae bacterium]|nr:hypothetical protein [Candidatus Desulfofervidaceae bacterium]
MQDKLEENNKDLTDDSFDSRNHFEVELRRAVKTVEVMGCIIKNRSGSLEKTVLENTFKEAINVHLRVLSFFFELIKREDEQEAIIDYISRRLEKIIKEKKKRPSDEDLKKISRIIFWNLNFFIVYGILQKIVHSLGSDKLTNIVKNVCENINTPASFLVKHGILMWYNKNLRVNEIVKRIKDKNFSEIARKAIKLMVVDYCALHPISYKDRQRIEKELGIPAKKFLIGKFKEKA